VILLYGKVQRLEKLVGVLLGAQEDLGGTLSALPCQPVVLELLLISMEGGQICRSLIMRMK
jgi:hypothetical protein